ncbi:MAG: NF038129 family PEP-CTERM protein, partial [Terriglobia bacterium]
MSKLIAFLLLAASSQAASVFSVSINTSALPAATTGYVDFLFNGAGPATASIAGFITNGTLNPASVSSTAVSGTLPGAVSLSDSNAEYLEGITFGTNIGFELQFSGVASGSIFTLSLLNATQDGAFLTSNVNDGFILEFDIYPQGVITPITFPTASGAPSVVSIGSVAAV